MSKQTHPNIQFSDRLKAAVAMNPGDANATKRRIAIAEIEDAMIRVGARDPIERDEWVPPSTRVPSYSEAFDLGRSVLDSARARGLVGA